MGIARHASYCRRWRPSIVALWKRSGSDGHPRGRCNARCGAAAARVERQRSFGKASQGRGRPGNRACRPFDYIRTRSASRRNKTELEGVRKGCDPLESVTRATPRARDGLARRLGAARARGRAVPSRGSVEGSRGDCRNLGRHVSAGGYLQGGGRHERTLIRDGSRTSHYDLELPADRIAQQPPPRRGDSRLMVVNRSTGEISHKQFSDLEQLIPPSDAIVLNTTRVFRARLLGVRENGTPAEVLLLRPLGESTWEAMVHPGGKLKPGRIVHIADDFEVEIVSTTERRTRVVLLKSPLPVEQAIEKYGHVPLPPYITRADQPSDAERYQTVYAAESGSVAAPTAGLHFTPEMLDTLAAKGVKRADRLLHVGAGTFKPVETEHPADHVMHEESFTLPARTAEILNETRAGGGKIWAVGTTSVRTLESAIDDDGTFREKSGDTRIFIRPPYEFRAVDRLITNFHLPRSTLMMLVAAFAGYDLTMRAYQEAVAERYRLYSYGDAMVIVGD